MRMSLLRSCRSGIGGSDIAAVFGLSAWKNRYQLYLEKTSVPESAAPAEPTGPAASLYWETKTAHCRCVYPEDGRKAAEIDKDDKRPG